MSETMSISPGVTAMLFHAAAAKGILGGEPAALLARLDGMAEDLFPRGHDFFSALFRCGERPARGAAAPGVREIGDAFHAGAFSGRETRRLDGSYYTPGAVIDRILDLIEPRLFPADGKPGEGGTLCDPALGCGYFPLRLAERLAARWPGRWKPVRRWFETGLFGADKEPAAVFMARALLWLALSGPDGEYVPSAGRLVCGDSLLGPPFGEGAGGKRAPAGTPAAPEALDWNVLFPGVAADGGFDCVVGNPPYEVLTNFGRHPGRAVLADRLRRTGWYADSLTGQINLYRCFIERSLDLLKPGGALSMVVPLSLARDAAARRLRGRLLERDGAGKWLLFGENDALFPGITQSACIFLAEKGKGRAETIEIASGGASRSLTFESLRRLSGGDLVLPDLDEAGMRLAAWAEGHCRARLDDYADMAVGEVDQTVYRQCLSDADTGCLLARGSHITPFHLDVEPRPGKERFLHLDRFLEMKQGMAGICRRNAGLWRVAQLGIRNMRSFPRLVAALAPPGVYLGNSLNVYYPKPGVSAACLAGLLNSTMLERLFRIASGNNNINLREMRRLPFPADPPPGAVAALETAFGNCARLAAGGCAESDLAMARAGLDMAAADCFRLPETLRRFAVSGRPGVS